MTAISTSKTVRILSLDGGGMRGYLSAKFLDNFYKGLPNLKADEIYKHFDIITGTSIGGIQALAYAVGKSPQYMMDLLREYGTWIFKPASGIYADYKTEVIIQGTLSINTPTSFYDARVLKNLIQYVMKKDDPKAVDPDKKMSDLLGKVIITAWELIPDRKPVLFSNITGHSFLQGSDEYVYDVGRATSAAPLYFDPAIFPSGAQYADGGVIQNNPAVVAYCVAKRLFPNATRYCILSVGTGNAFDDFEPAPPNYDPFGTPIKIPIEPGASPPVPKLISEVNPIVYQKVQQEWLEFRNYLYEKYPECMGTLTNSPFDNQLNNLRLDVVPDNVKYVLELVNNVFMGGVQSLIDQMMHFIATDIYDDVFYYRFQYQFTKDQNADLDAATPGQLDLLGQYADQIYQNDKEKIENFANHFMVGL